MKGGIPWGPPRDKELQISNDLLRGGELMSPREEPLIVCPMKSGQP